MENAKSKVQNLLDSADNAWICPITRTIFDRANISAIEEHKKEILRRHEKAERDRTILQKKRSVANSKRKIKTMKDLGVWLVGELQALGDKGLTVADVSFDPYIEKTKNVSTLFSPDIVIVRVKPNIKYKKNDMDVLGLFTDGCEYLLRLDGADLLIAAMKAALKKKISKLGIEELRALRIPHPEYAVNVSALNEKKKQISELRAQARVLEEENEALRSNYLKGYAVEAAFRSL